MYDNEKKTWADANPTIEKVGMTEEALLNAIDANIAPPTSAETNSYAVPRANLTLNPPLFANDSSKPNPVAEGRKLGFFSQK